MNNNENKERINYSPANKKINYYEQNPKLFKKQRLRPTLNKKIIINDNGNYSDINSKINFDENMKINYGLLDIQSNNCVSQPINPGNLKKNNNFCNDNILDDFLDELEKEEKDGNYMIKKEESIKNELNGVFEKNKYNIYFQTSRTQNPQFSNVWEDFHQKRDKL